MLAILQAGGWICVSPTTLCDVVVQQLASPIISRMIQISIFWVLILQINTRQNQSKPVLPSLQCCPQRTVGPDILLRFRRPDAALFDNFFLLILIPLKRYTWFLKHAFWVRNVLLKVWFYPRCQNLAWEVVGVSERPEQRCLISIWWWYWRYWYVGISLWHCNGYWIVNKQ